MFDGGNSAEIDHIPFKGFQSPSLALGKVDRLPQSPTTLSAMLKMAMQDNKLRSSSYGQGPKTALKFSLHRQLIPPSTTSGTFAFFPLSDHVVVGGPSAILGFHMLVAHQTQTVIQITCRRHGLYPPSFDLISQREDIPLWR